MKAERRYNNRKDVYPLKISSLSSSDTMTKIVRSGTILNASSKGILLSVRREDIIPKSLRSDLNLDSLVGDNVVIKIDEMNLDLAGVVARTKFVGKEGFQLAIDYSLDAPEYWRECLIDLLPSPEEFDDLEKGVNNLISLKNHKGVR